MNERTIEKMKNGLELLVEKPVVRYIAYGVAAVVGLYVLGAIILPILATFIVACKGLRSAIVKPV